MLSPDIPRAAFLAETIAKDFYDESLDLSARKLPSGGTWPLMPEVECATRLREVGVSHRNVRLFLTFVAAMDRARDAVRLWRNGVNLFHAHPDVFEPSEASAIPITELRELLSRYGVSQRHREDTSAWSAIAGSLATGGNPVSCVVDEGFGDAKELLSYLPTLYEGRPRFPLLKGPKIGPMWVRMLAAPGKAEIDNLDIIPIAVDTHVKRVTENLGVSATQGMAIEDAKPAIQSAWRDAIAATVISGPPGIADTCAALDPALWTFGKYGCSHCEKVGKLMPISNACDHCQLRNLNRN